MSALPTVLPASCSSADDAREHARRLLRRMGLPIEQVLLVDADSVLYLDSAGRPRTAWLCAGERDVVVHDEPGFSAQQPEPDEGGSAPCHPAV